MSEELNMDMDIVSVVDDDGKEHLFEEIDRIELDDDRRYVALLPIYEDEADLLEGDVDVYEMMKAVLEVEQRRGIRLPLRPDHGHQMCDDLGRISNPGYSCYGRLRSLAELRGIEHAIVRYLE